jgi:hypothetical protein
MKLVSVNTGLPSDVMWHGKNVTSAIFKQPSKAASLCASLVCTVIAKPTLASTEESTRPCTATPLHTMTT